MTKQPYNSKSPSFSDNASATGVINRPAAAPSNASVESKPAIADAIRKRAYEIYMTRAAKGQPGNAASDWHQAERELSNKR